MPTYLPASRYGGPIHSVHGLCKALAERGHEVSVITTSIDGDVDSAVSIGTEVCIDGVNVVYHRGSWPRRLFAGKGMGKTLKSAVAEYDIVHVHSLYLLPTLLACRAARAQDIPYVVSPRGMLDKTLVNRKSWLAKSLWIALFDRKNLESAAMVHVTSPAERRAIERFGFRYPEIAVIPNGLDPNEIPEPENNSTNCAERPYGLFLGRLSWKKGLEQLVKAWRYVPELDLVIAGNDDEGLMNHLLEIANHAGVSDRVHMTGFVQGAKKWSLLRGARLFMLPSCSENFGNAVLEAMAVGCPVVVTQDVGLSDIIVETESGILITQEPHEMGARIAGLSSRERQLEEMGRNGKKAVRDRFAWPSVAARMERAYRHVCGDEPRVNREATN